MNKNAKPTRERLASRWRRAALASIATAFALLSVVSLAGAESEKDIQHCFVIASPGTEKVPSEVSEQSCFDAFAEAINVGSSGSIVLPGDAKPTDLTDAIVSEARQNATLGSTSTLSVEYLGANYTGSTLTVLGADPDGCYSHQYYMATMPTGWDNVISSSIGYTGCWAFHRQYINFGGNGINCTCATMSDMDNDTSSLKHWRP